jgi:hypothetical protein
MHGNWGACRTITTLSMLPTADTLSIYQFEDDLLTARIRM